ncbi:MULTISPECIES: alanine racemase [unclassified Microbacterium]|uniref:alanine racemase n=1 Tax=unclassified Microbacterium TaxID=2609290 RepID=UPI000EAA4D26|nr:MULTISPECIES: alanine racemase [unclassified Microbacterium]MBT2485018.1 alanine racemase [Microbacterium sp. ISL-108]RKN67868.1 alanine racemase [Microbacterium sp. CGR2]
MTVLFREATVDLDAIADNVRHFRRLTGVEVIAVVKANAYGHGAAATAVAALSGGATRLGVAEISEALELRRQGVHAPIMAWLHAPGERFKHAAAQDIEVGISSFEQLEAAAVAAAVDRPVGVHLKFETGLSRNGIAPADWGRVLAEAARLERIGRLRVIGLFSHLSNTSADEDRAALARFEEGVAAAASVGVRPEIRHIAATAAAIDLPEMRLDAVRIGIGLYGLSPFDDRRSAELGLRPAMTLRGSVAAVRRVPAGAGVSYGYDYRTDRATTLVLVPLGYADGVPRSASGRLPVSIAGRRFTNVGRIAMDQFVVDVGDTPVAIGDEVVLFGDPTLGVPSATDWADAAGTINYEIVTRIGPRVPRRAS